MTYGLTPELADAANTAVLLVVVDFDGTISEIVSEPSKATGHPLSIEAIDALSRLERTYTAVLSGRGRDDLLSRLGPIGKTFAVGSHGAEFGAGPPLVTVEALAELEALTERLSEIASGDDRIILERKPAGVTFHYRQLPESMREDARQRALAVASTCTHVRLLEGSCVVEFLAASTNKGEALAALSRRVGATTVVFIGDDHTDEHAFVQMRPPDVGIKVGEGKTHAGMRVSSVGEVGELLRSLLAARKASLELG